MKRFNILLVPNFVNSVAFLSRMSEIVSVDSRFVKRVDPLTLFGPYRPSLGAVG
ncbi:hypothetical protein COLO4_03058 [Corchorus olitorius]|uniref:Uncharacterized protein n=1 Tax=Corchorus olitorius TaxID=93759 RepID=A0A1R3KZT5_9ROSI|nr:hypothetical protein COLO4_03058 [Corchorus olitorius]